MNNDIRNDLSIIIPCYNEEAAIQDILTQIEKAISKIRDRKHEIIVVDDGSLDDSAEIALKAGVKVIRHPKNLGYGKAILTGIDHSQYQLIAVIDADGTYDPDDFNKLIPFADTFDMVIGKRDMTNIRQSLFVWLLRTFLKLLILFFTDHHSPDPNSGLRIFKKDIALKGRDLFSLKFSFSTSLTVFAQLTNRFVEYVPIKYNARIGVSKVRHIRDSLRTFILILSMALIHRPLRYFSALILFYSLGLALFLRTGDVDISKITFVFIAWSIIVFLIALASIAFILTKIYETIQDKK